MKKKILSVVLAAVMLFSTVALSSCGKNSVSVDGKPKSGAMTTKQLKNVYSAKEISLVGTELEGLDINSVYNLDGSKLLIDGWESEGDYTQKLFITDVDLTFIKEIDTGIKNGPNSHSYLNSICVDSKNGDIWFVKNVYTYGQSTVEEKYEGTEDPAVSSMAKADSTVAVEEPYEEYTEDKSEYFIVRANSDGEIIAENSMTSVLQYTDERGNVQTAYVNGMIILPDEIFINCGDRFMTLDKNTLEQKSSVENENGEYFDSVFASASGKVYCTTWGENGVETSELDTATGNRTKVEFAMEDNFYNYSFAVGGGGYDFYVADRYAFYGYNMGEQEPVEICNYANSDIDSGYASLMPAVLEDGRLVVNYRDSSTGDVYLMLLTKQNPDEVKEKYIINIAGNYIDNEIRSALIKFNRTNDEYKVVFTDYSKYNTEENEYTGADDMLSSDLISKDKAPDIVLLNSYGGIDMNGLAAKGVFMDIEPLMDNDESFNREDYLQNVFEACKVYGKLYFITPAIQVSTLAGKKSVFGDKTSWTMSEFLDMHAKLADGEKMFASATRDNEGETLLSIALNEFIGDDGKCTFNCDDFKSILSYLKDIPADYTAYDELWQENPNYWDDITLSYKSGDTKLYPTYIYNFDVTPEIEAYLGEEPVFIGYPTSVEGTNGAIIRPLTEIAVISSTKVASGAWSVIKYLLSDSYQNRFAGVDEDGAKQWSYAFPVKKSIIEKKMADDIKTGYHTEYDENENEIQVEDQNTIWIGQQEVQLRKSTAEDTAKLYDIISNASFVVRNDTQIYDIIMQEAAAYFDGQKTVDEVAEIINSRVQILVNERR